jgi:hypothetical protein
VTKSCCYTSGKQAIAGPIHHYLDNPLLVHWFPKSDDFYTTASNFIRHNKPKQLTDDQTILIPWVQSILIKHYILRKEVGFQGQDNYVDLYQYLNHFLALYLMLGLSHTICNNLQWCPTCYTYLESDHHPDTVFIQREHTINWHPTEQPSYLQIGFLCLPSPWMYYPMTIISIKTWKQLAETTTSILSFKQG